MKYKPLSRLYHYKDNISFKNIAENRKSSEATCNLGLSIHGNDAFYINNNEITKLIEDILLLSKQLNENLNTLPDIAIDYYMDKFLVDEILITNEIEGVYSTRKEIKSVLKKVNQADEKSKVRFYGMIKKYVTLLNDLKTPLNSIEDLRTLYDQIILPEIADKNDIPDGRYFRKSSVSVYSSTQEEEHQGILGEDNIIEHLNKLLKFKDDENFPLLIRIAVIHYYMGYIHPFYDGNGRLSRFISSYLLKECIPSIACVRLSYAVKENKAKYYNAFKCCNDTFNQGDVTPFIITFLEIVKSAIENIFEQTTESISKLNYYYNCFVEILEKNLDNKKDIQHCIAILFVLEQNALFKRKPLTKTDLKGYSHLSDNSFKKYLSQLLSLRFNINIQTNKKSTKYSIDLNNFYNEQ